RGAGMGRPRQWRGFHRRRVSGDRCARRDSGRRRSSAAGARSFAEVHRRGSVLHRRRGELPVCHRTSARSLGEGTLMRRLLCLLAFAAPLCAQPVPLDCDKPADVMFTPASNRFNFQFQGNRGEAVYFRLVALNPDQNFRLDAPQVSDQYNSCPPGRVCNPTAVIRKPSSPNTLGDTPVDMSTQGFEYDLYADSTFTLQLQASVPQTSAEVILIMVRLNRPCVNTVQLSCGRATAGSISASTATTIAARPGQVDTYQFNANSGDILSIRLLRTLSSGALDTGTYFVLAVYGPDGHAIDADPKGYLPKAQFNTSTDLTISGSGTLTILVFEPQGYRGGNYFLS